MSQVKKKPKLVEASSLPAYPLARDIRLKSHWFIAWDYNRWLNSAFRLTAQPEVRAYAFDLFCIAQNQIPVGTLPDDDHQLAALLNLDLANWLDLRNRQLGPLHHWEPCNCDGEVRLMHPVVLEVATDAVAKKQANESRNEAARERKKMDRLKETVAKVGTARMSQDAATMLRIKGWLTENVEGSWTEIRVREAIESISMAMI